MWCTRWSMPTEAAVISLAAARQQQAPEPATPMYRSMLNTCGLHPHQYGKALEVGADLAGLDLEDSVPPASRDGVRRQVLSYLAGAVERRAGFTWAVRVNSLHGADGLRDLLGLIESGARPDALILPKVESAAEALLYDELLCAALPEVAFLVVIETARGLAAVEEIATATPRICALIFGAADFSAELGATMDWEPMYYARSRIVVAATRAGIPALDAPYFDIRDEAGLRREIGRARQMGFAGKVAVHPLQVPVINEGFSPSPAEIDGALAILDAVEKSRGQICVVAGRMIGPPAVIAARRTLSRAGKLAR
jgi:citrate lyase beta subunit